MSQEKIHTLADFWPLGALVRRPIDDAKARERWSAAMGARCSPTCATRSRGGSFDEAAVQQRLESVVRRAS